MLCFVNVCKIWETAEDVSRQSFFYGLADLYDAGITLTCQDGKHVSVIVQISCKHASPFKDAKAVRLSVCCL